METKLNMNGQILKPTLHSGEHSFQSLAEHRAIEAVKHYNAIEAAYMYVLGNG